MKKKDIEHKWRKGTMGNLTLCQTKHGVRLRSKTALNRERILKEKAFQRTRENMIEFSRACKDGKTLRTAFRPLLNHGFDSRMHRRLISQLMKVIKSDTVNTCGSRNVIDGEAELLEGFEFNDNSKLASIFTAPYTTGIDRRTGVFSVNIPPFIPVNAIKAPEGITHFRIITAAAEIDLGNKIHIVKQTASPDIPWSTVVTAQLNFARIINPNSAHPLFLIVGIQFLQAVNGIIYPLEKRGSNPLALVKVAGV
jgi:hypothetical protein